MGRSSARTGRWSVSRRIDYYDDPAAPAATSIVPSVNVVVTNDAGEVLLIRRSDNDNWAVPGGAVDLGESVAQAAVRETREESGIDCQITGVVGIYSDPKHVILYTSNGEVRQEFSILLTATATGGQPTPSSESSNVRWVKVSELADYRMDRSMRKRVDHYLERRDIPYIS
jgi:ADP-ribose pyrophosphatase YjhB (NUDIX family)